MLENFPKAELKEKAKAQAKTQVSNYPIPDYPLSTRFRANTSSFYPETVQAAETKVESNLEEKLIRKILPHRKESLIRLVQNHMMKL